MSVDTLFALCACLLIGIGLYGLIAGRTLAVDDQQAFATDGNPEICLRVVRHLPSGLRHAPNRGACAACRVMNSSDELTSAWLPARHVVIGFSKTCQAGILATGPRNPARSSIARRR